MNYHINNLKFIVFLTQSYGFASEVLEWNAEVVLATFASFFFFF